jgi:uncharacterized phiE125 gp8 family phage protein
MILTEITSISSGALPFYSLKNHLRLGTGFTEDNLQDPLLEAYLRAAISAIENKLGLAIIERRFSLNLTAWRDRSNQGLPMRPVIAIDSVTTYTLAGESTLEDPSQFRLIKDSQSPSIVATGAWLPNISNDGYAEVEFTAGYGAVWEDVPQNLGQATLLLASWFYENRTGAPFASGVFPAAVLALIEPYRTFRLGGV